MFRGTLPGGALRLSQNGTPLYHYSYLSAFAERCIVPEGAASAIRDDAPLERGRARRLRRDDRLRGRGTCAGVKAPGARRDLRGRRRRALCGHGRRLAGAARIVAVDPVEFKRETALELGATHALDPTSDDAPAALYAN